MPFITNMICTEYTNHQYDIGKTVTELCELRDGVAHCGVVNVGVVCHGRVRRQVSQGSRCRGSLMHELISPGSAINPLVTKSVGCLTSCGEAPQYVQMSIGSPNTL